MWDTTVRPARGPRWPGAWTPRCATGCRCGWCSPLEASLRGWPEKYPAVPIAGRLIAGDPGRTLAEVSEGAQLVVVGSRGLGGLGGLLSGSVSQHLLRHASCPVAVVPADRPG